MISSNGRLLWFVGLFLVLTFSACTARADEPVINQRFPITDSRSLSIPAVQPPIYECARAVFVYGFIPKALIQVYARNTTTGVNELVGHDKPVFSYGKIYVKRPLVFGEMITATQTVTGITSAPTLVPVSVEHSPPADTARH